MKWKRIAVVSGVLLGAAGLAVGGAVALGWHRDSAPPRALEVGALATPVTTDPTATDDPVVFAVLGGAVYPTVAQLATVTADASGYTVKLRAGARVTADQLSRALTHNHTSGSPRVKAALAQVDKVSTVDDHTVRITVTRPDTGLAAALAGPAGAVVVPGAGPYRISTFTPGHALTLTRAHGAGPATVHWHFYGDAESLATDLAGAKLDLVAPAVDVKLPAGAKKVGGADGPAIAVAVNPSHQGDHKLTEAVKSVASAAPAEAAVPGKPGRSALVLRTTNEPEVVAAAQTVRRQLAAAGIAVTVFASPPDQWRQLVDAGSYDLAVGTGLDGQRVGTVHYALIVTSRVAGVPRLGAGGALDLSTVHLQP